MPFDYTNGSDQYLVTFEDGDHLTFSDHQRLFGNGAHDARFHELIRLATTVFRDAYLKGDAAARDSAHRGRLGPVPGRRRFPGNENKKSSRGRYLPESINTPVFCRGLAKYVG